MKKKILFGFTLVEVIVALTIASSGSILLHQGVMQALRAEERRRWYEACAFFMDRFLERRVAIGDNSEFQFDPTLPLKVKIVTDVAADIDGAVDLNKVTITFTGPGFAPGPVVTYFTPRLGLRVPESN